MGLDKRAEQFTYNSINRPKITNIEYLFCKTQFTLFSFNQNVVSGATIIGKYKWCEIPEWTFVLDSGLNCLTFQRDFFYLALLFE